MPKLTNAAPQQAQAANQMLLNVADSLVLMRRSKRDTNARELKILDDFIEATLLLSNSVQNLIDDFEKL